jgi:hypothetical protein
MHFWNKTLHVSDISSVHHQELFTVLSAMVYVIQVCIQLSCRIRMELKNKIEKLLRLVGFYKEKCTVVLGTVSEVHEYCDVTGQ